MKRGLKFQLAALVLLAIILCSGIVSVWLVILKAISMTAGARLFFCIAAFFCMAVHVGMLYLVGQDYKRALKERG